jgi:hypothetical protein
MYAVADRPEGPYEELRDNALLAGGEAAPLSIRTFEYEGARHALYTDRERVGRVDRGAVTFGTLTTPKTVRASGGRLELAYSPRIEAKVTDELIGKSAPAVPRAGEAWGQIWQMPSVRWEWGAVVVGESQTAWGVVPLGVHAPSYIFEARVTLESAVAAGLAVRLESARAGGVAALDAIEQCLFFAEAPSFRMLEKREMRVPARQSIHLRVVSRLEHTELYVDDALKLAFPRYAGIDGGVGLFVDRGKAIFQNVRLRALDVSPPPFTAPEDDGW